MRDGKHEGRRPIAYIQRLGLPGGEQKPVAKCGGVSITKDVETSMDTHRRVETQQRIENELDQQMDDAVQPWAGAALCTSSNVFAVKRQKKADNEIVKSDLIIPLSHDRVC